MACLFRTCVFGGALLYSYAGSQSVANELHDRSLFQHPGRSQLVEGEIDMLNGRCLELFAF